jgi:adenylate kinase family enzyme
MTRTLAFQFADCLVYTLLAQGKGRSAAAALTRGCMGRLASVGGRTTHSPIIMTPITHEQREAFARLLQQAKQRHDSLFNQELEEKVKDEFLPKLVQRQGITGLVQKIGQISGELTESARALQSVDVVGRPDTFWGRLVRPDDMKDVLERMKRPYHEEHQRAMREYDLAVLRVMSAESTEEAREIVESLI